MARKSKRDWCLGALHMLVEQGAEALTIDQMTAQMGVTKGSFYHHFGSSEGFKHALLDFFEEEGTHNIAERVAQMAASPADRLRALLEITLEHPAAIDVAIRTWAERDDAVRAYQTRVDERRIAFVKDLWLEMIDDPAEALLRSQLLYTILVGSEHSFPPIEGANRRRLYNTYLGLYGLEPIADQ